MASRWQTTAIPFAGGVDTKIAKSILPQGKFNRLENCYQEKTGELRKREGFEALSKKAVSSDSTDSPNATALVDHELNAASAIASENGHLMLVGGGTGGTSSTGAVEQRASKALYVKTSSGWALRGPAYTSKIESRELVGDIASEVAEHSSKSFSGHRGIGSLVSEIKYNATNVVTKTIIFDLSTGSTIAETDWAVDSSLPRVTSYGNYTTMTRLDRSTGEIRTRSFDMTTGSFSAIQSIAGASASGPIAICPMGDDSYAIAYVDDSSKDTIVSTYGATASSSTDSVTKTRTSSATVLCLFYDDRNDKLYLVEDDKSGTDLTLTGYNSDLTSWFSEVTIDSSFDGTAGEAVAFIAPAGGSPGDGITIIYAETQARIKGLKTYDLSSFTDHGYGSSYNAVPGVPCCGVWRRGDLFYFITGLETEQATFAQRSLFIYSTDTRFSSNSPSLVAHLFVSELHALDMNGIYDDGETVHFMVPRRSRVVSLNSSGAPVSEVANHLVKHTNSRGISTASVNETIHFANGSIFSYDNDRCQESHFVRYPDKVVTSLVSSGSCTDGVHSVVGIFVDTDSRGNLVRTGISAADAETCGGGSNIVGVALPANFTIGGARTGRTRFYMTEAGGSTYYLAAEDNILTSVSISISDADLVKNELLYTTGGVLESVAPPSANYVAKALGRLVAIPSDVPSRLMYSKTLRVNRAAEFTGTFFLNSPDGKAFVAVGELDGRMIAFREDSILYIAGEGPNDLGQGSFSPFYDVPSDVGCTSPFSVLQVPDGIVFQSKRGLQILTRDLQVADIGAPVSEYTRGKQVIAAAIATDRYLHYFLAGDTVLAWDSYHKTWSTYPLGGEGVGLAVWQDKLVWANAGADVSIAKPGEYVDHGLTPYSMLIDTAWFQLAGLSGFQRVRGFRLRGEYRSPHDLEVRAYYDGDEAIFDTISVPFDKIIHGDIGGRYEAEIRLPRQKCSSVRLVIKDINQAGSCESFRPSSIAVEYMALGGSNRWRKG